MKKDIVFHTVKGTRSKKNRYLRIYLSNFCLAGFSHISFHFSVRREHKE